MIKVIIFDFFGVICQDVYWVWLEKEGFLTQENREAFSKLVDLFDSGNITRPEFYARVAKKTGREINLVQKGIEGEEVINSEVLKIIDTLKNKGYRLGLLSNSNGQFLRDILHQNNMSKAFEAICISSETGFSKPQPEAFQNAIRNFTVQADECLFIDDRPPNIVAAQQMGLHTFLFTNSVALAEYCSTKLLEI